MAASAEPIRFTLVSNQHGRWTLEVENRASSAQDLVISIPPHPDDAEAERTWTVISPPSMTSTPVEGSGEVLIGEPMPPNSKLIVYGTSILAEGNRVATIKAHVSLGEVSFDDYIRITAGNFKPSELGTGNAHRLIELFLAVPTLDRYVLDGLENGKWHLPELMRLARLVDLASTFFPDEVTIKTIGGFAIVDLAALLLTGISQDTVPVEAGDAVVVWNPSTETASLVDTTGLPVATHNHDAAYSALAHNHAGVYDPAGTAAAAVAALVNAAPSTLDTLNELATALGSDPNFATTMATALAGKQAAHANLTALAGITGAADSYPFFTGAGALSVATISAFSRGVVQQTTQAGVRSELGLGTSDSPQFTAVNIGHATDTTLARVSAGELSVEGNLIYRADGTDVPITDGGTGASSASAARTNLGLGTAATAASTDFATAAHTHTGTYQPNGSGTGLPWEMVIALSDETTAITTGDAKVTFRMPCAVTLNAGNAGVRLSCATASTSGLPTVDINEGGVSILSTKVTLDANEKTSLTAATAVVVSDTSLADDAEMTVDIDVAGTGCKGLKLTLRGVRA